MEFLRYHQFNISENLLSTKEKSQLKKYFDDYLNCGGFSEIVKGEAPQRYASALFHSIVNRDILLRYNIKHQRTFKDIALYLVSNYSREISFNRLKNIFGLGSEHTAKNYVHYLEESYVIFTLSKFSFKKQESLRYRKNLKIKELIQVSFNIEGHKTWQREVNALIAASNDLNADKLTIISKRYEAEEVINEKKLFLNR